MHTTRCCLGEHQRILLSEGAQLLQHLLSRQQGAEVVWVTVFACVGMMVKFLFWVFDSIRLRYGTSFHIEVHVFIENKSGNISFFSQLFE